MGVEEIKKVIYTCDKCGERIPRRANIIKISYGGNNDVSVDSMVKVSMQKSFAFSHVDSVLCEACVKEILLDTVERIQCGTAYK